MNSNTATKNQPRFFTAKNVATLGILLALVVVLQAFSVQLQVLTVVNLNLALVPIVVGAIVLGPAAGAFLGLACGVVVLIQVVMGINGFYVLIWTYSPYSAIVTTLICLLKTTVAGFVSGVVFHSIGKKNKYAATFLSSGLVPVVNTALFVLGCLCMYQTIQVANETGMNVLAFIIISIVTWNFFIEFAISLLLAPAVYRVYRAVEKQFSKKK